MLNWPGRYRLQDRVHCLGVRSDVARLTASLDLSCLASFGEAFGNVLVEAQACGVWCVSSDVGVAREVIGETGRVVPVGDSGQFAQAILEALALERSFRAEMGIQAAGRMQERFEIGQIAKLYSEMLLNVTKYCSGCVAR
jgi:glycosyltransferase involved in cell wall biosynthesis